MLNTVLNEGVEGKFPNLNSRGLHDWTALHLAANEGNYEIFRIVANSTLLIDLDSKSRIGQTALHIASSHGFVGIMELLIKKGAGVNMCD